MHTVWQELTYGWHDQQLVVRIIVRLVMATLLGAIVGVQREFSGKPAGMRTHMLVSLGTAIFVISCNASGMSLDALSRVVQGIVTGIGFMGAGTILKLSADHRIIGLTTAAGLWLTAAIGLSVGLGDIVLAIISTVLALIILILMKPLEHWADQLRDRREKQIMNTEHHDDHIS
jgi:putative Mg2+ transporter-C (MgtC) family protein